MSKETTDNDDKIKLLDEKIYLTRFAGITSIIRYAIKQSSSPNANLSEIDKLCLKLLEELYPRESM